MKREQVSFNKDGVEVHIKGTKTEESDRTLQLVISAPLLSRWISQLEGDGYLWKAKAGKSPVLEYQGYKKILATAIKDANISGKESKPYIMRKSRLTRLAELGMSEAQLAYWAGQKIGSPEITCYLQRSRRLTKTAIINVEGVREKADEEEKKESPLKPMLCPKCDTINSFDAKMCFNCGLDINGFQKIAKRKADSQELMELGKAIKKLAEIHPDVIDLEKLQAIVQNNR
jgi:integrase/recombinase XerD